MFTLLGIDLMFHDTGAAFFFIVSLKGSELLSTFNFWLLQLLTFHGIILKLIETSETMYMNTVFLLKIPSIYVLTKASLRPEY